MVKDQIVINSHERNIIIVNGEKYILEKEIGKKIDGVEHSDRVIFKKYDEEQYNYDLNRVIDAIADNVAKKELIREIVKNIDWKTLRRLVRRIESGKVIKKHRGCLGLKIGDAYLQLVD